MWATQALSWLEQILFLPTQAKFCQEEELAPFLSIQCGGCSIPSQDQWAWVSNWTCKQIMKWKTANSLTTQSMSFWWLPKETFLPLPTLSFLSTGQQDSGASNTEFLACLAQPHSQNFITQTIELLKFGVRAYLIILAVLLFSMPLQEWKFGEKSFCMAL